jgi:hypothetical protein
MLVNNNTKPTKLWNTCKKQYIIATCGATIANNSKNYSAISNRGTQTSDTSRSVQKPLQASTAWTRYQISEKPLQILYISMQLRCIVVKHVLIPSQSPLTVCTIVFYNEITMLLISCNVFQIADSKSQAIWNRGDLNRRDFDLKSVIWRC